MQNEIEPTISKSPQEVAEIPQKEKLPRQIFGRSTAWTLAIIVPAFAVVWMQYIASPFTSKIALFCILLITAVITMLTIGPGDRSLRDLIKNLSAMIVTILAAISPFYGLTTLQILQREKPAQSDDERRAAREKILKEHLSGVWGHDNCASSFKFELNRDKLKQESSPTVNGAQYFEQTIQLLDTVGEKYHGVVVASTIDTAIGEAVTFELEPSPTSPHLLWRDYSKDDKPMPLARCAQDQSRR